MDIQPDSDPPPAHAEYDLPLVQQVIAREEQRLPLLASSLSAGQAAELELRRSQDRFHALVRVVGQIIWTTNAVGLVVEDLPTWRAYTGQSVEEIMGWGWMGALHPDDRARVARIWTEAVATRQTYQVEYRLCRFDGLYRSFLVRGVPVLEADGSIREWVGCHTDITEHQQLAAEQSRHLKHEQETRIELETTLEALRESEIRYQSLVESNIIGVLIANAHQILDANAAFLKMIGYSKEDLRAGALTWYDLTPPEYHSLGLRIVKELQTSGVAAPIEKEFLRKDGSRVSALVGGVMLNRTSQTNISFVVDLTERRRAEVEQRRLERRTREALDALLQMAGVLVSLPDEQRQPSEAQASALDYGLVRRLAELARSVLGCRRINIVYLEPETEIFRPMAAVGLSPKQEQIWRSAIQNVSFESLFYPRNPGPPDSRRGYRH